MDLNNNWIKFHTISGNTYNDQITSQHIQNILEDNNIASVVINKKDSSYSDIFGRIEMYIKQEDKKIVNRLLKEILDEGVL